MLDQCYISWIIEMSIAVFLNFSFQLNFGRFLGFHLKFYSVLQLLVYFVDLSYLSVSVIR